MPKPRKQQCDMCGKEFKRVASHRCKIRLKTLSDPIPGADTLIQAANTAGMKAGYDQARTEQPYRTKDALIALTESITKLNQAFAQVIGEWRW